MKISVGKKMTIGMKDELRVYVKGDARPSQYRSVREGSMKETSPAVPLSDANLLKSTETLISIQDGIPAAGKRYVVEHDVILFEADIPAQHMWNPEVAGTTGFSFSWKRSSRT